MGNEASVASEESAPPPVDMTATQAKYVMGEGEGDGSISTIERGDSLTSTTSPDMAKQTTALLFEFLPYCGLGDSATDSIVTEALYSGNINVEAKDYQGNTLLLVACQHSNLQVVKILLRLGASPSCQNSMGACPLHFACYQESYNVEIAKLLLEYGANPNIVEYTYGSAALHYAAVCPDPNLVLALLSGGADVYLKDYSGFGALDYANQVGSTSNGRIILSYMGLSETDYYSTPAVTGMEGVNQTDDTATGATAGPAPSGPMSPLTLTTKGIEKGIVRSLKDANKNYTAEAMEKDMRDAIVKVNEGNPTDQMLVPSFEAMMKEFDSSEIRDQMNSTVKSFLENIKNVESLTVSKELMGQWRTAAMLECAQRVTNRMKEEQIQAAATLGKQTVDIGEHNRLIADLSEAKALAERRASEAVEMMKRKEALLEVTEQTLSRLTAEKESILSLKELEMKAHEVKLDAAVMEANSKGGAGKEKMDELMDKITKLQQELTAAQSEAGINRQLLLEEQKKVEKLLSDTKEKDKDMQLSNVEADKKLEDLNKRYRQLEEDFNKYKKDSTKELEESRAARLIAEAAQMEARSIKGESETLLNSLSDVQRQNEQLKQDMLTMKREKNVLEADLTKEQQARKKLHNEIEDMKGKIRVICRVRPFSTGEKERGSVEAVEVVSPDSIVLNEKGKSFPFEFDSVFGTDSSQASVFEGPKRLIQTAVDGFNVCIFAYGQTGSGKTFTMTGVDTDPNLQGITPRAIEELFTIAERDASKYKFKFSLNMVELYKSDLQDLLLTKEQLKDPPKLSIKRDEKGTIRVENLVSIAISTRGEMSEALKSGHRMRKTAATKMNSESSRSHLLQIINIETVNTRTKAVTIGKLSLVDLAGSERAGKTGATGDTLKEAISINQGLSALGDLIGALTSGAKHLPYRNHVLTELMSDSLGGSAKTLMFVNVSPADYNANETKNSLQFASRCRQVSNNVAANSKSDAKQVAMLRAELERLKSANAPAKSAPIITQAALSPTNRSGQHFDFGEGEKGETQAESPAGEGEPEIKLSAPPGKRNNTKA